MQRTGFQIMTDNYTFDIVKDFVYLGFAVTTKNDVSQSRISLANRCYYALQDAHLP